MTVKRNSPARRNSFAANSSKANLGHRRRAHSIAPGDRLSPAAKARRSLAPRKSILKAAVSVTDDNDDATQSMDITRDYRDDNATRKSLGRRVSFANHAHVRLFEVPDQNTNSTASPQSSPAAEPEPDTPRATNDENAYPGARKSRRRSSARFSIAFSEGGGEESMDMDTDDTGFSPSAFLRAGNEGSIEDEFDDWDGPSDGDDMEVTEVVPRNIVRKRSLSFGVPRQPLANLAIPQLPANTHDDQQGVSNEVSYVEEESVQSQSFTSEGNISQPMEFTVPLVRPSEPPSEAWLALRSATHSGSTPYIPSSDDDGGDDGGDVQEMELTDAVSRLQAARASLGLGDVAGEEGVENSFTSTEDSFMDEDIGEDEEPNRTVNVTQLMRRVSLGPSADSTMTSVFSSQEPSGEEAINQAVPDLPPSAPFTGSQEIDSSIPEPLPVALSTAPGTLYPEVPPDEYPTVSAAEPAGPPPDRPPVFSAPQATTSAAQSAPPTNSPSPANTPEPLNFTFTPKPHFPAAPVRPRSSSPAKAPQSPKKFTAAFAPPVARPSPRRQPNDASGTPDPSPGKWPAERLSITPGRGTGAVRVLLSPSKASPLQLASFHGEEQLGAGPSKRPSISFRWPPGYSAQRKSLGSVFPNPQTTTDISPTRKSIGQLASLTSLGDSEGQERHSERPSPLGNIPNPASPFRKSLAHTLGEGDRTQPDHDNDAQQGGELEGEGVDESQGSRISIEQFFEMTGIRFMDDIAAPRRSVVNPSALRPSRRVSMEAQIPLAEYMIAMAVNVPQLELYSHVGKDLQTWVERIKEIHKEAEAEAQKATPPLFQEFVSTDESGQAELLHQLKLIKVHNHAQAKSEWYDWKAQWVEQLYQKTNEGFENLETDAKTLEGIIRQAQDIVPALQQEYDELMAELERERAEVAELEGCDRNYLNELKTTLAEQSAELDTYHADVREAQTKLDRLQERLDGVRSQKKEVVTVVEDAERRIHVQKNSTRAEIFHLKDELEALQGLHMWKATKVQADLFEFSFASTYNITRTEDIKTKRKEISPLLTALILRTAKQLVTGDGDQSTRQIVQRLSDYWSSCAQLQTQLRLVSIKFSLSIEETPSGFCAIATILFPKRKAKALISFILDTPVFSSWPLLIQSARYDVRVVYGPVDRDTILKAVTGRMQQTTPVNNHGCLLDACMEAMECFA